MTDDLHTAVRIGLRQAGDRMMDLEAELDRQSMDLLMIGRSGGSMDYDEKRLLCVRAFAEAAERVIRSLISHKGNRAANRRGELVIAMERLQRRAQAAFDSRAHQMFSPRTEPDPELQTALTIKAQRILLDFDEGAFHMAEDNLRGGISIGSIGQMAGHIGSGNSGAIQAEQTINDGDLLDKLAAAIQVGVNDDADRAALLAAVEAMNAARDDKKMFAAAYGAFIARAADYTSLIAPFIPALGQVLIAL